VAIIHEDAGVSSRDLTRGVDGMERWWVRYALPLPFWARQTTSREGRACIILGTPITVPLSRALLAGAS